MRAVIVFSVISLCLVVSTIQADGTLGEHDVDFSLYQIYPRSFKDSDGDGIGDLKGIASKLNHLVDANIDAFWLSPFYPSPMVDFGYDISNFREVDPIFGTMKDFEDLVEASHNQSLKVIIDLVPNHSSDQHEWFQNSLKNIEPYSDYYVWHKGKVLENGTAVAPNNWLSIFGGPAWTWREERQAYYLHQFAPEQPDLNYNNPKVVQEMKNVMRFWLRKGVDGFRVDAVPHLCEDPEFRDEPPTDRIHTKDQPRTYEIVLGWRQVLDEFSQPRFMMIEAYANTSMTMKYYRYGAHFPFNFGLITDINKNSGASDFKKFIDGWMSNMPKGSVANWVAGNHDNSRLITRLGLGRARAATLMTLLLPGVSVTYNGDEIGMTDTEMSWEETQDPQGCNAGPKDFKTKSRDPERSPFQWDDTTSAGFSKNSTTWLRVNDNYKTVNLKSEKADKNSFYNFYKAISFIKKKSSYLRTANLTTMLLSKNVLGFSRKSLHHGSLYAVMNFAKEAETVDLSAFDSVSSQLYLYYCSEGADLEAGHYVPDYRKIKVPASGSMVFISPNFQ